MKYLTFIFLLFSSIAIFAQHHDHDHHLNHLGIGTGITSFISEDHSALGYHIHYMRRFNDHSPLSLGLGYEGIAGDHPHHSISALIGYSPFEGLSIKVGPGLTFVDEDGHNESSLSGHLELMYEFELGDFHLGPMIGYGNDGDESHATIGVHVGLGF